MRDALADIEAGWTLPYDQVAVELPEYILREIVHEFGSWPDANHWKRHAVVTQRAPQRWADDGRTADGWLRVGHCAAPLIRQDGAFVATVWLTPQMRRRGRGVRRRAGRRT